VTCGPPTTAFFLFGPRGTGKSTWIRTHFDHAHVVNLLPADSILRYERDPAQFRAEVLSRPVSEWIVVDEVQRVPRVLDEVHSAANDGAREEFLRAYVTTYLAEEIKAESLVRDLGRFSRFLEVASLAAGQRTNVASIARDAAVSRETARGYFEILVDTP
jgi:predicted AAA+ superfamily ATPase